MFFDTEKFSFVVISLLLFHCCCFVVVVSLLSHCCCLVVISLLFVELI